MPLSPLASWLLLALVWCGVAVLVYGVLVTGSRGSRLEERLTRRPNGKHFDNTVLALHAYRGGLCGGDSEDAGEVPPLPQDAA